MTLFESPQATLAGLRAVGYLTTEADATAVFIASRLNRPLLLEGPAGAGKTQLAVSVCEATNMKLLRLQCYAGITDKQSIGDYSRSLQDLYVLMQSKMGTQDWPRIKKEVQSREFFASGPLLDALESEERCVLLIDEIDKVDSAFEAMLLQLLSVWEMSIPGMGTIHAKKPPFTVITSNGERVVGFPLRRRCLYLQIGHPSATIEAEIVAGKTPTLSPQIHRMVAAIGETMRDEQLEKPPSISEMVDFARAMVLLDIETVGPEHALLLLPMIAKTERDLKSLLRTGQLASILDKANVALAQKLEEDARHQTVAIDHASTKPHTREVAPVLPPRSTPAREIVFPSAGATRYAGAQLVGESA